MSLTTGLLTLQIFSAFFFYQSFATLLYFCWLQSKTVYTERSFFCVQKKEKKIKGKSGAQSSSVCVSDRQDIA